MRWIQLDYGRPQFSLRSALVAVVILIAVRTSAADDAWPFVRHDPQNTARSLLASTMTGVPEGRVRYSLGGAPHAADCVFADLDGDGSDEIITVAGGPTRAFRGDGRELWRTLVPRGKPQLLGTADLDGDGRLEVIGATSNPATAHVFSGTDGRILWERSFDEQVTFGTGARVADLDGDGASELILKKLKTLNIFS